MTATRVAAPTAPWRNRITGSGEEAPDQLLATGFGPGFNGPLLVAIERSSSPGSDVIKRAAAAVAAEPGVLAVTSPATSPSGAVAVFTVIPRFAPQAPETHALVDRLREQVLPGATGGTGASSYVGGMTPVFIDLDERVARRLPLVIGVVVALSVVLLVLAFRSLVVALTAAVLNIVSISAAFGVVVAVFQWGWGLGLVGLDDTVPIASVVPMLMFAIVFGLSMDYEVFLLSRIREATTPAATRGPLSSSGSPRRHG